MAQRQGEASKHLSTSAETRRQRKVCRKLLLGFSMKGSRKQKTAKGINSSNRRYRKLAKFPFPLLSTASLRVIG